MEATNETPAAFWPVVVWLESILKSLGTKAADPCGRSEVVAKLGGAEWTVIGLNIKMKAAAKKIFR